MRKLIKLFNIFLILMTIVALSGCKERVEKDGSPNAELKIRNLTCNYYNDTNITVVTFDMKISNESIYNMYEVDLKFGLYNGEKKVSEETYGYSIHVKTKNSTDEGYRFKYRGKIDSVDSLSYTCKYASFWHTYSKWLIATIVISAILIVVSSIAAIAAGIELEEFGEYFWVIFPISVVAFIPYITISSINNTWNWVPAVIIICGLAATILVDIIIQLIAMAFM